MTVETAMMVKTTVMKYMIETVERAVTVVMDDIQLKLCMIVDR